MDLLEQHHRAGRRFEPIELVEEGPRVAVQLAGGGYKVFTFADDGTDIVHLQDCLDRADALARLAAA